MENYQGAKLAKFSKDGRSLMLVAYDVYRPAAIDQLEFWQNKKINHLDRESKDVSQSLEQVGRNQNEMVRISSFLTPQVDCK